MDTLPLVKSGWKPEVRALIKEQFPRIKRLLQQYVAVVQGGPDVGAHVIQRNLTGYERTLIFSNSRTRCRYVGTSKNRGSITQGHPELSLDFLETHGTPHLQPLLL